MPTTTENQPSSLILRGINTLVTIHGEGVRATLTELLYCDSYALAEIANVVDPQPPRRAFKMARGASREWTRDIVLALIILSINDRATAYDVIRSMPAALHREDRPTGPGY